jgi:phage gpG-like protein
MEHFTIDDRVLERLRNTFGRPFAKRMVSKFQTATVEFSKERFVKKDWINKISRKWAPRKKRDRGSLMVRTGRLKRSIRKMENGAVGTDVPYAEIHNSGGNVKATVTVRSHIRKRSKRAVSEKTGRKLKKRVASGTGQVKSHSRKVNFKMPKRQFLGQSERLNRKLQTILSQEIQRETNNL